eukprot:scaffold39541_cov49-Phaeocystis_antarctica.AAC.3
MLDYYYYYYYYYYVVRTVPSGKPCFTRICWMTGLVRVRVRVRVSCWMTGLVRVRVRVRVSCWMTGLVRVCRERRLRSEGTHLSTTTVGESPASSAGPRVSKRT